MREDEDPRRDDEDVSLGRLEREEGVLRFVDEGREVGCDPAEEDACLPGSDESSYDDDPVGGASDPPYSMGEAQYEPIDEKLPSADRVLLEEVFEPDLSRPDEESADERELWDRMRQLSDQDEEIGGDLAGISEEEGRRVLDSLGDDAGEILPEAPEGRSATGASSEDFRPDEGDEDERL